MALSQKLLNCYNKLHQLRQKRQVLYQYNERQKKDKAKKNTPKIR
jgi:hypothetical protein